jgi:hypothetical protein
MDEETAGAENGQKPRVRFSGIVESAARDADNWRNDKAGGGDRQERNWNAMSRQVWQWSRLVSVLVFFCFVAGLPLGNWLAHREIYGSGDDWSLFAAFDPLGLVLAFIVPIIFLMLSYYFSRIAIMMSAAESIAAAAQQFVSPDLEAVRNVDSVGELVRGHMGALNEGLDDALSRLASVEAMIRDHVAAIELAGEAIELRATGAVERVADERARLMDLTESLNAHADLFAAAIAERAQSSIEKLQSAEAASSGLERDFDERLTRLEEAAGRALSSFESLRAALGGADESLLAAAKTVDAAAQKTMNATARANAAADAAAESAARNAANVAASANQAAQSAQDAASRAILVAQEEAANIARAAIEAAARETDKVRQATAEAAQETTRHAIQTAKDEAQAIARSALEAAANETGKAIEEISQAARQALDSARADAEQASETAKAVARSARETSAAAQAASKNVAEASEQARKSAEEAIQYTDAAAGRIDERNKSLLDARAALQKENERLENLIDEQRKRAERLADAISSQTERLTRLAEAQLREQDAAERLAKTQQENDARLAREAAQLEAQRQAELEKAAQEKAAQKKARDEKAANQQKKSPASNGAERLDALARDIAQRRRQGPASARGRRVVAGPAQQKAAQDPGAPRSKGDVSWREILDAADDAEPLELGAVAKKPPRDARDEAADAIRIIAQLQDFTCNLETRLYGEPPPALQERFDRGDRNVFANRLLRLNEADVRRRIRSESARDREFERDVHLFLQGFERLLEDATTSETADEELEEYLGSPLGRVYLLIGATVGYFA